MGSALFNLTDKSWTTSSGWQQLLRSGWKPSGISDPFAPLERDQSYPSQQGKAITPKRIQLRKVLPPQECWNSPFPQNAPQILVLSLPNQRGLKMRWDCAQPSWDTPVATLGKPPQCQPIYSLSVNEAAALSLWVSSFISSCCLWKCETVNNLVSIICNSEGGKIGT